MLFPESVTISGILKVKNHRAQEVVVLLHFCKALKRCATSPIIEEVIDCSSVSFCPSLKGHLELRMTSVGSCKEYLQLEISCHNESCLC